MNTPLSYTEQLLSQMHARALRGVLLALGLSALLHLGVTLTKLGGDSFAIRFDRPTQSGDPMRAQLKVQPPASPAPITPTAPATQPLPPSVPPTTAPPVLRDRASVNLVERDSLTPVVPTPIEPPKSEPIPMPAPLPEPTTRRFEAERSNAPTRVERSERLPAVAPSLSAPQVDLKPLPPIEITPPKREPAPAKQAELPRAPTEQAAPTVDATKAVAEPPKAAAEPTKTADAPKAQPDTAKAAASEPAKSVATEAATPAPSSPQSTTPAPAAATPSVPVLSAPAAASQSAPATSTSQPASGAAAPSAGGTPGSGAPARGATVTLPGPAGIPGAGNSANAPAAGATASGERDGALRPGLIDGFDPNAARRNAARDAARDLNARRAMVPPSVAPSPTAREREAKAIEDAVRRDCSEQYGTSGDLITAGTILLGQLVDKGCKIRIK